MIQHQFVFFRHAGRQLANFGSTAPRVPGVLPYVLLHCCTAVCSKGLVGGWVEGALRRPWWVGGPFRTWESFFVMWEMNLVICF